LAAHFQDVFGRQIRAFGDVNLNRVMPTFANVGEEPERMANEASGSTGLAEPHGAPFRVRPATARH
jgi:hypothetical protein